jgi:hypothetical protein
MTNYLDDSFGLYITFLQGVNKKKSFVIDTAISWRDSYQLGSQITDAEKFYHLKLKPRLLLKIYVNDSPQKVDFSLWDSFNETELNDYCVISALASDLYFIDEQKLKEKITKFFNSKNLRYISVWGDWEEIIKV